MTEDKLKTESETATGCEASAVERLVMFFWNSLGEPTILVVFMFLIFLAEAFTGFTDKGTIAMLALWLAFFLTKITIYLEEIAKNTRQT